MLLGRLNAPFADKSQPKFGSASKFAFFPNNYTVFEETNCIAILRTNYPTKQQSLSEIDFLRFATMEQAGTNCKNAEKAVPQCNKQYHNLASSTTM